MRTKLLLSSLIVGAGLAFAPAAFAQSANIGKWPVETDADSMYHFERMACFQNPQEADCVGFGNNMQQAQATMAPTHAAHQVARRVTAPTHG